MSKEAFIKALVSNVRIVGEKCMNREDRANELAIEKVEILRGRLEQAELALQAIAYLPIAEQDDMPAANMRAIAKQFLASQQWEQVKHPEQAEGAQGEREVKPCE